MGTYTTNYNLFMPSIGEQGWGEIVNNNFSTIDTTMGGLDAKVGTLETEMDAVETRVTTLEAGEFESINCAGTVTANDMKINLIKVPVMTSGILVIYSETYAPLTGTVPDSFGSYNSYATSTALAAGYLVKTVRKSPFFIVDEPQEQTIIISLTKNHANSVYGGGVHVYHNDVLLFTHSANSGITKTYSTSELDISLPFKIVCYKNANTYCGLYYNYSISIDATTYYI